MKTFLILLVAIAAPALAQAQETPPSGFAELERTRSQSCVAVLARVDQLNARLQPLGLRAERIRGMQQAVALEDRAIMEELDQSDELEAAVHAWFVSDGRLAQSYVESRNEELARQRTVGREQIKATLQNALTGVQAQAEAIMEGDADLSEAAGPCDGAILIRPVVLETCQTQASPVCDAAASAEPSQRFRFVASADDLWDVQELRPWSPPGPLRIAPDGTLAGARTVAFARHGNIVFTVAFAPLIQPRTDVTDEQAQQLGELLDSIGLTFDHPDLVFAPSIAVRATLPQPLAGEDLYVLHFGPADDADLVWSAPAGTGTALEAPVVLQPRHLARLQRGESLQLTAIREVEAEENEALFTLELTQVNQAPAVQALLGYMAGPMVEELKRLVPPGGGR